MFRTILGFVFAILYLVSPASVVAQRAPLHDLLLLQTGAGANTSALVVQSGGTNRSVSAGVYSSHTHTMYVATPAADGTSTVIRAITVASGRTLHTLSLSGQFSTDPSNYAATAMSFNGRWLALRSTAADAQHTAIAVIDTRTMRVVAQPLLLGQFGLDAIDATGASLYLIESLPQRGPETYQVRSYNLRQGSLDPSPVLEKGETVGTMSGVAHTRAWSVEGDWLFTLYVRPGTVGAFIHSLGLEYRLAHCIFLPDKGVPASQMAQFTLAVSPNGEALYAVNPALGRITAVNAQINALPYGSMNSVTLSVRAPFQENAGSATVSRDGRRLFVATGDGLWVVNTSTLKLRATYLHGQDTRSVARSSDGRRLYVLQPARHRIAVLAVETGALLATMPVPASAWTIQQVMH